jgi:hypothetical protein
MTTCKTVRAEIQEVFDTHGRLSRTAREHLDTCPECAKLHERFLEAREEITRNVEEVSERMGPPILDFLHTETQPDIAAKRDFGRRVTAYLPRAAAILAIVLIPVVSYFTYDRLRVRSLIRGDASEFVDQLFTGSFFDASGVPDDTDTLENMFSATVGVSEYEIELLPPSRRSQ